MYQRCASGKTQCKRVQFIVYGSLFRPPSYEDSNVILSLKTTHFRAVVCFGLQFIHGNQSFKEAAFQKAHRSLAIKTGVRIGQDDFEGNGEAGHVHREGTTGAPASVKSDHLGGLLRTGYNAKHLIIIQINDKLLRESLFLQSTSTDLSSLHHRSLVFHPSNQPHRPHRHSLGAPHLCHGNIGFFNQTYACSGEDK